jgi:hypothetical protein
MLCHCAGFVTWVLGEFKTINWGHHAKTGHMIGFMELKDLTWVDVDGLPFKVPVGKVLAESFSISLTSGQEISGLWLHQHSTPFQWSLETIAHINAVEKIQSFKQHPAPSSFALQLKDDTTTAGLRLILPSVFQFSDTWFHCIGAHRIAREERWGVYVHRENARTKNAAAAISAGIEHTDSQVILFLFLSCGTC